MLALCAWAAASDPAADWKALYEARFVAVADGTPDNAARLYEATLLDRGPADALFVATSYWLGRARLELGDLSRARGSLAAAAAEPGLAAGAPYVSDPEVRDAARELLEEVALRGAVIVSLPVRFDFEGGSFPGVRAWSAEGAGLEVVGEPGRRAAAWSTVVGPDTTDHVTLRFADTAAPAAVSVRARLAEGELAVRWSAVDEWGARWRGPVTPLTAEWTEARVSARDLEPPEGAVGPMAPGRLTDVALELVPTGTGARGRATLWVDDILAE